jgi:gas vesicle protein GvpA/GvpJ/GvpM family
MSEQPYTPAHHQPYGVGPRPASLADVMELVLDKGVVIAGDIQVNLLEIELLTIKLRLLIASVDKAREMGINWWESDPSLSSQHSNGSKGANGAARNDASAELGRRVDALEAKLDEATGSRQR